MPSYLVESYVPKLGDTERRDFASRARAAAEELSLDGTDVGYLRSLFVADDETCFHVFEAPSLEVVEEASRRAGFTYARIVAVMLDEGVGQAQIEAKGKFS